MIKHLKDVINHVKDVINHLKDGINHLKDVINRLKDVINCVRDVIFYVIFGFTSSSERHANYCSSFILLFWHTYNCTSTFAESAIWTDRGLLYLAIIGAHLFHNFDMPTTVPLHPQKFSRADITFAESAMWTDGYNESCNHKI